MAIDAMGRFVPDNLQQAPARNQVAAQQAIMPTASMAPLAARQSNSMSMAQPSAQNAINMQQAQAPLTMAPVGQLGAARTQIGTPENPSGMGPAGQPPPPVPQQFGSQAPSPFSTPNNPQAGQMAPVQQQLGYNPYMMYRPMNQPSIAQMAAGGGPQSVQNYMNALRNVGAGGNNAQMASMPGQGAGPQAGFQGFGMNGQQQPMFINPGYVGPMQSQLGFQGNMAGLQGNYMGGNAAQFGHTGYAAPAAYQTQGVQAGGFGGTPFQPQWQTPGPWYNPANSTDLLNTDQSYNMLFGKYDPTIKYQAPQSGSFYSGDANAKGDTTYGLSDETAKEKIKDAKEELSEFLDALGVYSYEYKNPEYGDKRYISPMAQELEKSQLGKDAVVPNQEGLKMVDYGRLAPTQLAATALLHHRLNVLENKLKQAISNKFRGKNGK